MFSSYTPIICHLKRLSLTALGALCLLWPPASRAAELTVENVNQVYSRFRKESRESLTGETGPA